MPTMRPKRASIIYLNRVGLDLSDTPVAIDRLLAEQERDCRCKPGATKTRSNSNNSARRRLRRWWSSRPLPCVPA